MESGGAVTAIPPRTVRKTSRRNPMLVACVVIAALAIVAVVAHRLDYDREGTYDHHYYVNVEASSTEQYTIRLPVPHDANDKYPLSFVDEIVILEGNATLSLGVFGHGLGLEVRASGNLEFEWSKWWPKSSNVRYGNLTMTVGAEGYWPPSPQDPCYSWIFSDRSNIRVQFLYSCIHEYMASPNWASGGGPTFGFLEYPQGTGWERMPLDYGWLVIN